MIFQNEKTPFQAIKTRSSKSQKIDIFLKGLTHGFGPKMALFPTLFFGNIGHVNFFYDILKRKNAFLRCKNKKFKRSKNLRFCKRVNPWYLSKTGHFSDFSSQAIKASKISFTIFKNDKTPFYAIKTRSSKSRKIDVFPKGLANGFVQNMAIFPTFFLSNIGQENVFYDILERKNSFVGYKNNKFTKSKN